MKEQADLPEPDRVEGAPHPRETHRLLGQDAAQAAFLDAFTTGRMHHGWLLTGPRGVGKATLAWKLATFLLATPDAEEDSLFGAPPPPTSLDIDPEHPVARRVAAQSDPGLFVLRRAYDDKKGALKTVITVDEARRMKNFFALSNTEGGRRVVIVDAADEMNVSAANAILKILEEPPEKVAMFLISHQPSRLLPTIRSRCRELRLGTLNASDMAQALTAADAHTDAPEALAELSGGSVGEAIRLTNLDGLAMYAELVDILSGLPRLDRTRAIRLAEAATGKANAAKFDLLLRLFDLFLSRLARAGVMGPPSIEAAPGEALLLARLCPNAHAARTWAEQADILGGRARHGRAVNLDPSSLILDTVLRIDETAAQLAATQANV